MDTRTRILLLEDEPAERLLLAAYLRQAGHEVLEAETLAQGRAILREQPPTLSLIDLNLPDGDGLGLARELRLRGLPVIIVTCRVEDRIPALELGIDDFMNKPYHPRELLARVQNVLRRCQDTAARTLRCGAFRLEPERRRLLDAAGTEVALTPGEFSLLEALAEARGRALNRTDLAELISAEGASSSVRSVDVLISRLRQKLEPDPGNPCLLLTVPGVGYRLQA